MSTELLDRIRATGITDPAAGQTIHDPEIVLEALGANFQYSQPIEAEVAQSYELVEALWRSMSDQDAEFFDIWLWQEDGHAITQLSVLNRLGLAPEKRVDKARAWTRAVGAVASATPGLADAMEVGILTYMALGEQETKIAYQKEARILNRLGEYDLARAMGKMAHQEGLHLEYQRTEAGQRYLGLNPWQQRLVRAFIESQYRTVGVQRKNCERMRGFGHMIMTVSPDDAGKGIADTVQALAAEIVEISPSSQFVAKRYKECLEVLAATA